MARYQSTQRGHGHIIYKFWHLPEQIKHSLHVLRKQFHYNSKKNVVNKCLTCQSIRTGQEQKVKRNMHHKRSGTSQYIQSRENKQVSSGQRQ